MVIRNASVLIRCGGSVLLLVVYDDDDDEEGEVEEGDGNSFVSFGDDNECDDDGAVSR